jgi:Transglycosylase SLT domain
MPATLTLSPTTVSSLQGYSNQYGVDPNVVLAMAQVESGGDNSAVSPTGAQGIMQLEPSTFYGMGYTDISDPQQNMQAGVQYFSQQVAANNGDYTLALAAYNAGPGAVSQYDGVPPFPETQNYVTNVSGIAQSLGSTSVNSQSTISTSSPSSTLLSPQSTTTAYAPEAADSSSLISPLQIDSGLNVTAWFNDPTLVTGNPQVRKQVQPVSFTVYLTRDTGQQLVNPSTNTPIVLQLNTSLKDFHLQSKHVFTRTPSRTGMHITMWGMEMDFIQGSGTTGVFMNRFGLADFWSMSQVSAYVQQVVESSFGGDFSTIVAQGASNPNSAFRVAAQDAFVEFMKLFQMNGNVWYYNSNYSTTSSGNQLAISSTQDQSQPTGWSSQSGTSGFGRRARNNDVMSRGYVAMKFRNSVYLGYFKSLSFDLRADKPYTWDFNFVFQVEKTFTTLYYPSGS